MRSLIGLPSLYPDQPCLSDNHNILVVTNFGGNRSYASALLILCLWADCAYVGLGSLGSLGYAHNLILCLWADHAYVGLGSLSAMPTTSSSGRIAPTWASEASATPTTSSSAFGQTAPMWASVCYSWSP